VKAKEQRDKLRISSAKRKKRLRDQIEKRKVELGIADRQNEGKALAILFREPHHTDGPRPLKTKPVIFFKLEDEEARDKDAVEEFMRKYARLWKNLFTRYQNVGFSHKNQSDMTSFDNIQNKHKEPSLTFAETTKVLKDHDVYPQLMNKQELTQMVRGCNVCMKTGRQDLLAMTFDMFKIFLVQLAVHCYSRPPQDLSCQPMVRSLQALVNTFEEATRKRKLSTVLYEDIDAETAIASLPEKERELVQQLDQ